METIKLDALTARDEMICRKAFRKGAWSATITYTIALFITAALIKLL